MSTDDELVERVRTLRAQGCTPKQIACTVGVPAARVTALVRAMAAEQAAADPHQLVGCWVSPQWSGGLTVTGHPQWLDADFDRSELHGGLAPVDRLRIGQVDATGGQFRGDLLGRSPGSGVVERLGELGKIGVDGLDYRCDPLDGGAAPARDEPYPAAQYFRQRHTLPGVQDPIAGAARLASSRR